MLSHQQRRDQLPSTPTSTLSRTLPNNVRHGPWRLAACPHHQTLLQTCKQIYDEAQGIFYDINAICMFDADLENFILTTSARRLRMIKTLQIYAWAVSMLEITFKLLQPLQGLQHFKTSARKLCLPHIIVNDDTFKRDLESLAEHILALQDFSLTTLLGKEYKYWFNRQGAQRGDKVTQVRLQRIIDGVRSRQGEVAGPESYDVP